MTVNENALHYTIDITVRGGAGVFGGEVRPVPSSRLNPGKAVDVNLFFGTSCLHLGI